MLNKSTIIGPKIIFLIVTTLFVAHQPTEAQLLNKLKNKVNSAINDLANDTVEEELSLGDASITHDVHGLTNISKVDKTKVIQNSESTSVTGTWWTNEADIFDGFNLEISEAREIISGTYSIGSRNSFTIGYDPQLSVDGAGRAVSDDYQNLEFTSGNVTISSMGADGLLISFNGKASMDGKVIAVSGEINTKEVQYIDQRRYASNNSSSSSTNQASDNDYDIGAMMGASNNSADPKPVYSFNHKIAHEITTNQSKDVMKMAFLFSDSDYYGIGVDMKDYGQSGESFIVMDGGETHMFINAGGMKMRMSQMPGGAMQMPNQDFQNPNGTEAKKTGATKVILGYTCYEYIVKDEETDAHFWVTTELDIDNWMSFPENEIQGHVLEYDINSKDGKMKSIAVSIEKNLNLTITSSEYRKGF